MEVERLNGKGTAETGESAAETDGESRKRQLPDRHDDPRDTAKNPVFRLS
jgi:hypothetical protein